ncbi:uncharacterized protein LOC135394265 [Ornithodoros turicata]|uniref:uncharacterized protein LOC135394265 n=1 Tax=Ornithodoros turicata TaxID=34597 RepID=UPI00313A34D6
MAPTFTNSSTTVYLQTFRSWAVSDEKCLYVRGLFDTGSQKRFVRENISKALNLPVITELDISINTFATTSSKTVKRRVVQLKLRNQFSSEDILLDAIEIPVIRKDIPSTPACDQHLIELTRSGQDNADGVIFPGVPQVDGISLLVGSDQMWRLCTGDIRRYHANDALVAMNTKFGWTLQGPSAVRSFAARQTSNMICVLRANVNLNQENSDDVLNRFWELENIAILDECPSADIDPPLKHLQETATVKDGRYEVRLPWKPHSYHLDDNLNITQTRLSKLVSRLQKDEKLLEEYDEAIRRYVKNEHAGEVPVKVDVCSDHIYYMPHRKVIRESSTTTKPRVVFDAPSHAAGTASLNDCLESGPKLNPNVLDILIRFRT